MIGESHIGENGRADLPPLKYIEPVGTRRGDTGPAGWGLPLRIPLSPTRHDREDLSKKCGLLTVKLQSPLPNFI
jgi:hypothetical protein